MKIDKTNVQTIFEVVESQILLTFKHGSTDDKLNATIFINGFDSVEVTTDSIIIREHLKLNFVVCYFVGWQARKGREEFDWE